MLTGLQAILEKEVVLSTVNADDLLHDPQKVESDYQKHVQTFIPMGDITDFSARVARRVVAAKTPKGMIVAPYGYGKTSTLAFLWRECEQQSLVAVPPFYCANLLDILKATYGWVKFRLQQREPALVTTLDEIYSKYTAATVDEMATRYSREHGLAKVTAVNLLNDMLKDGSLILELTPSNLLFFLDGTANLVTRAGFKGLVVLPDEFQQYFSKGANLRRTIQEFREFIWGLDTRSNSLGVIFSVPTYAEAIIQEQGKDILHRLKKDDLYYRLQDIYTLDFPSRLWLRYVESFQLKGVSKDVIDEETLQALGQIAEREDLGEGPRTVIDGFKRAILHCQDRHQSYTPINLIDDFLESNINFQAQTNKLKMVTRQALDSAVVNTPERKRAVKLLAAFPRGCSTTIQQRYELYDAVNALSKRAHGELMTHLVEGYTLLGLSRTGGPTHTVDVIITRFWQSFEEDELHLEAAIRAFNGRLLPRFFERRRGPATTGWGEFEFVPTAKGSYLCLVEGSFNPRYPRRRLALQIAYDEAQFQPFSNEADLQFDFLFARQEHEEPGSLILLTERLARFHLNIRQKMMGTLPQDLQKLQEFVNPEFVTPLLMLSLVNYFDRWEEVEEQTIPASDKQEIEHLTGRLINYAVQLLFNQGLATTVSPPLRRVGLQMVEELFSRLCNKLYKQYHTFFVHAQHEKVLNDYINAMQGMTLKERRGHASINGTKDGLARRFALSSVATFENRIESEYINLIEKSEWSGRGNQSAAEIRLKLHPLEEEILKRLRSSSTQQNIDGRVVPILSSSELASFANGFGYRDEEILLALQLLVARRYSRFDSANKIIYLAQIGPDATELQERLEQLAADLDNVGDLLDSREMHSFQTSLSTLKSRLPKVEQDEEELDELQTQLSDLNEKINNALSDQRSDLQRQLNTLLLDVERAVISLRNSNILDREISGQVAFVMHLNELRQRLAQEQRQLVNSFSALRQTLTDSIGQANGGPISETRKLYHTKRSGEQQQAGLVEKQKVLETEMGCLQEWIKLLKDTDRLFNTLSQLPDLREQLTQQVVPEIQVFLTKHGREGLSNWEPFRAKVGAVEEELEKRRRHGNETFTTVKERYEHVLREISVGDYRPRARYTYGEDAESYRDLYDEVRTKFEKRLDEIANDLSREQTDLLKAHYINIVADEHRPLLQQVTKQLAETETALQQVRKAINPALIQQGGDELDAFGKQINELTKIASSARQQLGPVLFADHELSDEETKVLQALGSQNELDLTDLFVRLHRDNKTMTLTKLLNILEGLYRKHRLSIRVRPRG
jgi:hypothetical protein